MPQPSAKRGVKIAFANLPSDYRGAIKSLPITQIVKEIGERFGFSESEIDRLDKEVIYLLVRVQNTPEFMQRLEQKLNLTEHEVAELTQSVTDKIIRPLQEKMDQSDTQEEMPVPEPPTKNGDTPTPEYGGNTDPYREPAE